MTATIGLVVPGPIDRVSGGYGYARALLAAAPDAVQLVSIPDLYPEPTAAAADRTTEILAARSGALLIDGLAYGVFPDALLEVVDGRAVALVHHPLALETGLPTKTADRLRERERASIARACGVVASSRDTAQTCAEMFDVSAGAVAVVEPGVTRRPKAARRGAAATLLAVGAAIPRKNFSSLVGAMARLAHLEWRLRIVGPLDADPDETARLRSAIAAAGLGERIALEGVLSGAQLDAAFAGADLFVSSSVYEGYGMAVAEAMTAGLPIVAVDGGAVARTAPSALLSGPEPAALADAIGRMMTDRAARASNASANARDAARLPDWPTQAAKAVAAVRRFTGDDDDP